MKIEHVAWQVADPVAVAGWYVEHLGFNIRRQFDDGARARFLADDSGAVMLEVYHNDAAPMPDYPATDPLVLHLALLSDDPDADADRLAAAGTGRSPRRTATGSRCSATRGASRCSCANAASR